MKDSSNKMANRGSMHNMDSTHPEHNMGNMPMSNMAMPAALPMKTIANNTPPYTVRYDLYVTDTIVTFSGKSKRAIAVNGQIPMPHPHVHRG